MAYREKVFNANLLTGLLSKYLTHQAEERDKYYEEAKPDWTIREHDGNLYRIDAKNNTVELLKGFLPKEEEPEEPEYKEVITYETDDNETLWDGSNNPDFGKKFKVTHHEFTSEFGKPIRKEISREEHSKGSGANQVAKVDYEMDEDNKEWKVEYNASGEEIKREKVKQKALKPKLYNVLTEDGSAVSMTWEEAMDRGYTEDDIISATSPESISEIEFFNKLMEDYNNAETAEERAWMFDKFSDFFGRSGEDDEFEQFRTDK